MYTLANLADVERGWGLANETFRALEMVRGYGGDDWSALGDRDLATHLLRSQAMRRGESLSHVTDRLRRALGIEVEILPMADGPLRTFIETRAGEKLPFQEWLVRRRAADPVRSVHFEGETLATRRAYAALEEADLVLIGPSNPYVSIDPILSLSGIRQLLGERPVFAISPLVKGRAVKGPLATMIPELTGQPPTTQAIALHYGGLLRGMVVERGDDAEAIGVPTLSTDTIMDDRAKSRHLAQQVLAFAASVLGRGDGRGA